MRINKTNSKTNMKTSIIAKALICTIGLLACQSAHAISLTLGGPLPDFRTATLSDAVAGSGLTGSGNAREAVVENGYGGDWTERGSVDGGTAGPGTISDGMLTVQVLSGNWGSKGPLSGNWTVNDPTFWTSYAQGAISLHVGNGGADEPDHFIWKLTPGLFSGTWSYDGTGLRGGGLSNLKLYSDGTGTTVPDGGATMALLGLSLLGMTAVRKAMAQPKA
jgi:hypothetical protein